MPTLMAVSYAEVGIMMRRGYIMRQNTISTCLGPSERVRGIYHAFDCSGAGVPTSEKDAEPADFTRSANDIKCRAIHKIDINRFMPIAVKTIFLVTKRNMILGM